MGYSWFLKLALYCIDHLAWPLLALGYPLCASVHAIETDSYSETRDLMSYWILLSLIYLFEHAFLRLLSWFQFWPYIKLMIIFSLTIPNFGRASYVYNNLIRSCITLNAQAVISRLKKWRELFVKKENFLLHAERYIQENGTEALEMLIASKIGEWLNLCFHHGGNFVRNSIGELIYEGGHVEHLLAVDEDTLNVFYVAGYYKELGYHKVLNCYWKCKPGRDLSKVLRELKTNKDLLDLVKDCKNNDSVINLYFEHPIEELELCPNVIALEDGDASLDGHGNQSKAELNTDHDGEAVVREKRGTEHPILKETHGKAAVGEKKGRKHPTSLIDVDSDSESINSYESIEDDLYRPHLVIEQMDSELEMEMEATKKKKKTAKKGKGIKLPRKVCKGKQAANRSKKELPIKERKGKEIHLQRRQKEKV